MPLRYQVEVTVDDEAVQHLQRLAKREGRCVAELVSEAAGGAVAQVVAREATRHAKAQKRRQGRQSRWAKKGFLAYDRERKGEEDASTGSG